MSAALKKLLIALSPFEPHACEAAWHRLGADGLIVRAAWPDTDAAEKALQPE